MVRRFIAVLAVLFLCLNAGAADYWHLRDYVTTRNGTAISGASIRIYDPNTTTAASDVHTSINGWSAVSWPLVTDNDGMFECYLPRGNYDINIEHTGWAASKTWDNYMVGTGSDSLGVVSADSLTIHGTGSWANLRFGGATDDAPGGHIYLPHNHTLWVQRSGGDAQRVTGANMYNFGIGEHSIQYQEESVLSWAFACSDDTYNDRTVLGLDDSSAGDSLGTQIYQTIWFRNTRADSTDWMMPDGTVKGVLGGDWGTPDKAVQFYADVPDSDSVLGARTAFEFRWDPAKRTNSPLSIYSSIVNMQFGNDNIDYSFQRRGLILQAAPTSTDEKVIQWDGGSDFTQLTEVDGSYTYFRVNNGELHIKDDDQSDDAKLKIAQVYADTLNAKTGELFYIRAADGQDDAWVTASVCSLSTFLTLKPTVDPPPAVEGRVYMDTDHHIYCYNGTAWKQLDN